MLSSLGMVSCEDFLTETNPNYVTDATFPTTAKHCEKLLIATYNTFRDVNNYSYVDENLRADTGVNVGYNNVRANPNKDSALQNFTNSYTTVLSKWAALYTGVFAANQTLEAVEKVRPDMSLASDIALIDLVQAEAHMFRGLYYFWLHNGYNFGKVPLVTKVPENESEYYNPCSSSAEVVAFYRSELKKAIAKGMLTSWTETEYVGRVTMYTALAVLGKSYLYQASSLQNNIGTAKTDLTEMISLGDSYEIASLDNEAGVSTDLWTLITKSDSELTSASALYETAEAYFKYIIDNSDRTLEGVSVGDNMTTQGEFNNESLLEVSYTTSYNSAYTSSSEYLYHSLGNSIADCTSSYESIAAPYWLVEQYESDPVDMAREDMNFIQIELSDDFDATGDIVYERLGNTYDRVYTNDAGTIEYDDRYVMHIGTIGTATVTNYYLCLKRYQTTLTEEDDGSITRGETTGPTYSYIGTSATRFSYAGLTDQSSIKYINGEPHRRIQYSWRASYNLALNGDESLSYYTTSVSETASFSDATTGYFRKMTNWDIIDSEVNLTPANASEVNIRLIRLSDIYLMYAESLIKGGTDNTDILEAIDYVNKIRYRAGVSLIGQQSTSLSYAGYTNVTFVLSAQYVSLMTGEMLRDGDSALVTAAITDAEHLMGHLMYVERPLELSFEGQSMRVNDVRRWGILKDRFKYLYSSDLYVTQGLAYLNSSYTASTRWAKQYRPWEQTTQTTYYSDYKNAMLNYNYDEDAYWPIPSSEVLSNPYIN